MIDKIGSRWFIIAVAFALAGWASYSNWPLNLGIDLSGGTTLTYRIEKSVLRELIASGEDPTQALEQSVAVISTRIDTMGVKDLSVRREGADGIQIQAPSLTESETAEIKRRMLQLGKLEFLIGLGDLESANSGDRDVSVPGRQPGTREQFRFKQADAEAQRQKAITDGKALIAKAKTEGRPLPQDAYRDGTTYELKSEDGRPLGIFWKPWTPSAFVERKNAGITVEQARNALGAAASGNSYDPAHIGGGWLYADPDYYGPGREGFTGKDIEKVGRGQDELGRRTVRYDVALLRQSDFKTYTGRYVNRPMCLVLNDEIWSNPNIQEALSDSVQIQGGRDGFTEQDQDELINCLQSGSLKLRPILEGEDKVGATLGSTAVDRGVLSTIVGSLLIFLFAIVYYRTSGVIAVITLVLNLLLTIATMLLFRSTLTLPGIAGLALTLGMAIDANILIFERIREELDKGKSLLASVQAGFDRAFITIIDSNLTTVITAVLLYKYGVGPIKGFAVTLTAGLICSLFTAVFVAKTLFAVLLRAGWMKSISYRRILPPNLNINFLSKTKPAVIASTIAILLTGVAFFASGNKKYGLDFTGGYDFRINLDAALTNSEIASRIGAVTGDDGATKYTQVAATGLAESKSGSGYKSFQVKVQSLKGASAEAITTQTRTDLAGLFADDLEGVQTAVPGEITGDWSLEFALKSEISMSELGSRLFGYTDARGKSPFQSAAYDSVTQARRDEITGQLYAKAFRISLNEKSVLEHEVANDLKKVLAAELPKAADGAIDEGRAFTKMTYVGPNVVHNLKQQAIVAIVLSLLANIAYLWFRFREVKYGIAAVVAVLHDAIIALGAVVVFNALGLVHVPIDLPIIAGILTVMGYSLNDTIVIFDRVRENIGNVKGTYREILNHSLNQTLDRTILTSLLTFVSVVSLFVFNYGQESGIEGMAFTLLVGLIVGTYSTIYIATPVLIWMHNRDEARKAAEKAALTAPKVKQATA